MDWRERRAPSSSGLFKILWEGYIEVGGIDSFLYWKEKNVIVSRVAPLSTGDALSPQPQWWPDLLPWTHLAL